MDFLNLPHLNTIIAGVLAIFIASYIIQRRFGTTKKQKAPEATGGWPIIGAIAASEEKEARRCQKVFREFFHLMGQFLVGDTIPWLGWLDLGGHEKAMKKTGKEMECLVSEWLEEHKQTRASGEANKRQQDFMAAVMPSILDGVELAGFDADSINKATCLVRILS